jgi:hypothetical protein
MIYLSAKSTVILSSLEKPCLLETMMRKLMKEKRVLYCPKRTNSVQLGISLKIPLRNDH